MANFSQNPVNYTISTSSNPAAGGTTSGGGTFQNGQSCTVTANANNGYTFINWTENGTQVSITASYPFTVSANRTLVANFSQNPVYYTISTSANPAAGGTTSGGGTFQNGQSCTVTANANNGYTFINWTENGTQVSITASYPFTVSANRTLVANFSQNPENYTISTSSNPAAGGTTSGGGTYQSGQSCTVTASSNNGYTFTNWTENGTEVSLTASYPFTVSGNRTLVANFTSGGQTVDLNNGLIAYYPLNCSAEDVSGNGNHGVVMGSPTYTSGVNSNSIHLVGYGIRGSSGDHVLLPTLNFNSLTNFSISIWVKEEGLTFTDGEAYINYGNDGGSVKIGHFNNSIYFTVADADIVVPFINNSYLNNWVLYTLVYTSGTFSGYINGNLAGYNTRIVNVSSNNAAIGRHWFGSTSTRFIGKIDEVRIYNRALNDAEILALNNPITYSNKVNPYFKQKSINGNYFNFFIDYNNDGRTDMITRELISGKIFFYRNSGTSYIFEATLNANAYSYLATPSSKFYGSLDQFYTDVDNDGNKDLVVYSANHADCSNNSVRVYWGNSTFPYFEDASYTNLTINSPYCVAAYAVDFDNAGLKDIFIESASGINTMHKNNGSRNFSIVTTFNTGRDIGANFNDYDGDGLADLCYTKNGWADGQWGIRFNKGLGNGNFSSSTITNYTTQRPVDDFVKFQANPLTNTTPDILFNCSNDGTNGGNFYIGEWNSSLTNFSFNTLVTGTNTESTLIQAMDYNNDGYDDIIMRYKTGTNPYYYTTIAYLNNGNGNFSTTDTIMKDKPYYTHQLFKDNDGLKLAAYGNSDTLYVFTLPTQNSGLPASAGTISGPATVCQGANNVTYSVPDIAYATSYLWTLPAGATGSSTTNTINVNFGDAAASGDINVKGHNDCGDGNSSAIPVTVSQPLASNLNWPINYETYTVFTTGLNVPTQMVQNPAGEIFVTNHSYASYSGPYSHTIAKIDGLGNKSVFVSGYSIPTGLEIDQQQNLYFTRNNFSYSVYKVLPDGNVSVFTTLPHMPNPITLYQKGSLLDIFTVSHWGSKGIYRIDASGTYTLFNDLGYTTCQITPDGQYLYACSGDILYRISTVTGIREIFVTTLTNYQIYLTCIGPDNKLYVAARSFTDPTKNSIYRINGINDFTEIISNIPINYEENDILFKPSGVNDYDLYVCEMAGDRTNPDFNRIIKFPTIFSGSASLISGPDTVQQGQNNLAYSVAAIPNATSYLWSYSGTGATINGNSNNITISFASNATSGILNVKGSNVCGEGPSSFDFPVTVLTGVLANQVLQNLTITPGQVKCYDATQTITVAGNGTPFIVQDGGSVSLIAGQNIRFLPGVKVNPGGYIHGYITTTSEYCFSAMKPEALVQTKQVTEERIETVNWSVKVFPNPTTGILNLALKTSDPGIPVQIRIYNLLGEMIYSKELIGKNTDEFSLADEHPGIYLLHVVQGGRSEVVKVIRQ